jgi:putative ABC transport system permease protein
MFRNYITVSLRSLLKNKIATVVNVLGLSISMVIGVFLFGMVKSNWETDHFHPFLERTFRVITKVETEEKSSLWATCPAPISQRLTDFSSVDKVVTVRHGGEINVLTKTGGIPVKTMFTEPTFFQVFGFKTKPIEKDQLLKDPNSVLLGEKTAKKLYGNSNAIGQVIKLDGWGSFVVAGIVNSQSQNSHIPIEVMLSLTSAESLEKRNLIPTYSNSWEDYKSTSIYFLTHGNTDIDSLNKELSTASNQMSTGKKEKLYCFAQDIESITPWNPEIVNDFYAGMNWQGILLWVFLAIALTVLAAFNYTALSIARIFTRAREVGIRKANGAIKRQIMLQFITEAVLLAVFALVIAYIVVLIINLSGGFTFDTTLNITPDAYFIPVLLAYTLLTGFVAGVFPAILLSKFKIVDVLKNLKNVRFLVNFNFYKIIVVTQCSGTRILLIINLKGMEPAPLIAELEKLSQVQETTVSNYLPINNPSDKCNVRMRNIEKQMSYVYIDAHFAKVFGLTDGVKHNLLRNSGMGQFALINESAARLVQNTENSEVELIGETMKVDTINVQIAGIIANQALHVKSPTPTVYLFGNIKPVFLSLKTAKGSSSNLIRKSIAIWSQFYPDNIPEIYSYKGKIMNDAQTGMDQLNLTFGLLCSVVMFVACLGILGIANYSVQANLMQIGIRKTFGANNRQLIFSVTYPFVKLILVAGIIGIPLSYAIGNLLKSRFGENVKLNVPNLTFGFCIVALVAISVVVSQTFRAIYIEPKRVLQGY